jgi:hypothetical protein
MQYLRTWIGVGFTNFAFVISSRISATSNKEIYKTTVQLSPCRYTLFLVEEEVRFLAKVILAHKHLQINMY